MVVNFIQTFISAGSVSNKLLSYSDSILRPHLKVVACNPESHGHFISPEPFERISYKLGFISVILSAESITRVYRLKSKVPVKVHSSQT